MTFQASQQNAHIKRSVVCDQAITDNELRDLVPELTEGRRVADNATDAITAVKDGMHTWIMPNASNLLEANTRRAVLIEQVRMTYAMGKDA